MAGVDMDLRTLVTCPFDKAHVMRFSKFHNHFVKCQKQHPEDKRKSCPYNFSELIYPDELEAHMKKCAYRLDYGSEKYPNNDDCENTVVRIDAPYNLDFGPDDEGYEDEPYSRYIDSDEEIDSISVVAERYRNNNKGYLNTNVESCSSSAISNNGCCNTSRGRGAFLRGQRDRVERSFANVENEDEAGFSILCEENIHPKRETPAPVPVTRSSSVISSSSSSSGKSSFKDERDAALKKLRALVVDEKPRLTRGRGRGELFGQFRRMQTS